MLADCSGPTIKVYQRNPGGAWQVSMRCQGKGAETQYWHTKTVYAPNRTGPHHSSFITVPWGTYEILAQILLEQHKRCVGCASWQSPCLMGDTLTRLREILN